MKNWSIVFPIIDRNCILRVLVFYFTKFIIFPRERWNHFNFSNFSRQFHENRETTKIRFNERFN